MRCQAVVLSFLFLTGIASGQDVTLEWLNPAPTANTYFSLAVFDSLHVAALGYTGDVVRSSDGGVTWRGIGGSTSSHVMHYASAVLGDGSVISLINPEYPPLLTTIVKSEDSCRTWETVFEPQVLLASIGDFDGLLITTGLLGTVYVSGDGGVTWEDRHIATSQSIIACSMHTSGRLVATGIDSLYFSADTGRTWSVTAAKSDWYHKQVLWSDTVIMCMSRNGNFQVFSETGLLLRERKFRSMSLFAFQDQTLTVLSGDSSAISYDQGLTWESYPQDLSPDPFNSMEFIGRSSLIAAGGVVARSTDNGRTWTTDSPLPRIANAVTYFFNNDSGLVVAGDGAVQRTLDGGKTWTIPTRLTRSPNDIAYLEEEGTLFLTSLAECYRSTDLGLSWHEAPGLSTTAFIGLARLSSKSVAVATMDEVFLSGDVGRNWTRVPLVEHYNIRYLEAISFADANFGAILSEGGRIHVTRDGGLTWAETGTPDAPFRGDVIACPSPGTIVTTGSIHGTAYIYESTDAGSNWQLVMKDVPPESPSVSRHIWGMKFRASGQALAYGTNGAVHFNINGHWISKYVGWLSLYAVACPSDSVAYIVGDQGTILKAHITGTTADVSVTPVLPSDCAIVGCSPNPAREQVEISVRLNREIPVSLHITDLIGRRIRILHQGMLPAGESRITAALGNLPSGVYRLLLTSPSGVDARSIMVLR